MKARVLSLSSASLVVLHTLIVLCASWSVLGKQVDETATVNAAKRPHAAWLVVVAAMLFSGWKVGTLGAMAALAGSYALNVAVMLAAALVHLARYRQQATLPPVVPATSTTPAVAAVRAQADAFFKTLKLVGLVALVPLVGLALTQPAMVIFSLPFIG